MKVVEYKKNELTKKAKQMHFIGGEQNTFCNGPPKRRLRCTGFVECMDVMIESIFLFVISI
jgi:hypothetical protein